MINRRNFIKVSALAAIGTYSSGIGSKVFGQIQLPDDSYLIPPKSLGDPVLSFTSEHFAPFINTSFQINRPQAQKSANLRLVQVRNTQSRFKAAESIRGESYSLLFESEGSRRIEPAIYDFSHTGLGRFSIFISPVTSEPNLYEAVISHLNR